MANKELEIRAFSGFKPEPIIHLMINIYERGNVNKVEVAFVLLPVHK